MRGEGCDKMGERGGEKGANLNEGSMNACMYIYEDRHLCIHKGSIRMYMHTNIIKAVQKSYHSTYIRTRSMLNYIHNW